MTSTGHADGPGRSRVGRVAAPYREIFSVPGAWRFSAAGVIGRIPMAMTGLATVLLISRLTGLYGIAGAVSAAGALGYGLFSPLAGRLADRLGQRRVLLPLAVLFALSCAALIVSVVLRGPVWTWFVTSALSGATMPSLESMVRARWSALLTGTAGLHTALSFESVADEVCYMIGPAMVTVLATGVAAPAGVAACAVLCVAGTVWFTAQRSTEPPPARRAAPAPRHGRLAAAGLAALLPAYVCLGAMFVCVDLSTVRFAQHVGHEGVSGFILGVYALGSATGGLWYGAQTWRSPLPRRFAITLAVTLAGVATLWAQPGLITLTCVMYLCGLAIAPTLATGYAIIESQARPGRLNEATALLTTGLNVGVAVGSAVVGYVLDSDGPRAGYVLAACLAAAALLIALACPRVLRTSASLRSHPGGVSR